jgi:hypothetical protein
MPLTNLMRSAEKQGKVVRILEAWRMKHEETNSRQPDGYWHPSSIAGCPTAAVYEFLGFPLGRPRHDARLLRIFDHGHAIHDMLQTQLIKSGLVWLVDDKPAIEFGFTVEKLKLRGSIDAIINPNGKRRIFEVKSKNSNSAAKLKCAEPHHIEQGIGYVIGGEAYNVIDTREITFLYYGKDDSHLYEFEHTVTDADIQRVYKKLDTMNSMVEEYQKTGTIPKPYYSESAKPPCRGCPWASCCHATMHREEWIKTIRGVANASSAPAQVQQVKSGYRRPPPRRGSV